MQVLRSVPIGWPVALQRFARWTLQGHPTLCSRCGCLPRELSQVKQDCGTIVWLCPPCCDWKEYLATRKGHS